VAFCVIFKEEKKRKEKRTKKIVIFISEACYLKNKDSLFITYQNKSYKPLEVAIALLEQLKT
jgi:hypothetical protein